MGRLAELQRKLLEQIMGAEAMGIVTVDISMWDPRMCRPFLTGICPHDLFTNTKMDLGSCSRTHSVKVKNEYASLLAKADADKDLDKVAELNRLRVEYENTILGFVDECDRRIRAAQRRLEKTPEENNRTTALMREIGEIEGAFQAAMGDVESLGSEGKVEESMLQLTKAEALKAEKQEKERELQQLTENSGASGHQKLRVCDVCGAYLSILDSDRRLADHFGGKMHLGYLQLRTTIDEWRTRGPLPVSSSAPTITSANGNNNGDGNNWSKPASAAPTVAPVVAALPTTFRPIPASKLIAHPIGRVAPSAPPSDAPTKPSGDRSRVERSDRDRDDRSSRDKESSRSSRRADDDRDRERSSRRSGDSEHRSSSNRYKDDEPRSSSRRDRGDDESGERKERSSRSSRDDRKDDSRSSRREHDRDNEDGEMPEEKKRRRE